MQKEKVHFEIDINVPQENVFDFLTESTEMWKKAGELSYLLRQKGKAIGLSDCYISVTTISNNVQLLTLDRHFEAIGKEVELHLYVIPPHK